MSRHIFIQEHSRSKNQLAERNLTFLNSGSKILWFKSLINSILPKGADKVFNLFKISILFPVYAEPAPVKHIGWAQYM